MSTPENSRQYAEHAPRPVGNVVPFSMRSGWAEKVSPTDSRVTGKDNSITPLKARRHRPALKMDATSFVNRYLQQIPPANAPSGRNIRGFAPSMSKPDLQLFHAGHHLKIQDILGAHLHREGSATGVRFAVWAPAAIGVSVTGDFNQWNIFSHPMTRTTDCGVWETFIPDLEPGMLYKFNITRADGYHLLKTDPYGRAFELRPASAAIITAPSTYVWGDDDWLQQREARQSDQAPLSVYEVHAGSWQRDDNGGLLNYRELAHRLADYVKYMGFTHVELLPITEYPLDESWGYQTTGYFAPTSRYGTPDDFRYFVDYLHRQGIGVILDWVPAHFPRDEHGLARFDGTPLYEHADSRLGEHLDWGTYIPNYGRNEVRNFFLASALFWLEEYHIDGLRVDAVASMLYRDYSRKSHEWLPNQYGGNENLEAIAFLQELTRVCREQQPGTLIIAEESTSWPGVTADVAHQGLGFSLKWNMGWMHDTLGFLKTPMAERVHAQNQLTFSGLYAWSEKFLLSFSHDEVVHEKSSLLHKMAGTPEQQYDNLKLLYTLMHTWPGSKLLFMGGEFGQRQEWNHATALSWDLLAAEPHQHIQTTVRALNRLHAAEPSLHQWNYQPRGFQWVDCHNPDAPVVSWQRNSEDDFLLVLLNFGEQNIPQYRLGVPESGWYQIIFQSNGMPDSQSPGIASTNQPQHGRPFSISLNLPGLSGLIIKRIRER